jgi:hypothetical protein
MEDLKLDTAALPDLVEQTVAKLRNEVLTRIERAKEKDSPRPTRRTALDASELQHELEKLDDRIIRCRRNLESTPKNREARIRFIETSEKRAAALKAALHRVRATELSATPSGRLSR